MIGIVDLRSLGYYKIKQGLLQQNLSKYYRFERVEILYKYFNKFINTLKKEREQIETEESYPWLDSSDERKYMTDQEILDKYIALDSLCLTKEEKKEVMLISRTLTKDKRVVTDFRHLNVRIAKNNLAYPLLKDTCSVLGCSKCEVLSVLDLKDTFHSLRLSENSRKYCGILPYIHMPLHMAILYQCNS